LNNEQSEKIFVKDLEPNTVITTFFLVKHKEVKQKKTGEPYMMMTVGDKTGSVTAIMWNNFQDHHHTFERDDFVKIKAEVALYNNRVQLVLHKIRRAEEDEIALDDYFPSSKQDPDVMYKRLKQIIKKLSNPHLKKLLNGIFSDPKVEEQFKKAPAAKALHHVYLGGLLEHTLSVVDLCILVADYYKNIHKELLVAGALLHDIGKIYELTYDRSFDYSDEGRLYGHIIIEFRLVQDAIAKIKGFPQELERQLLHMLLSHHGTYEYGSPRRPKTPEALLLHYIDDMDAKYSSMISSIEDNSIVEGDWSTYNRILDRYIYRKRYKDDNKDDEDINKDEEEIADDEQLF
jgi:3'-5' exoribonuclease